MKEMKVKIVWKGCADGHWRKGEDITDLPKLMSAEEIEEILSGSLEQSAEFEMEHMPNFEHEYSLGNHPINFKILSVTKMEK